MAEEDTACQPLQLMVTARPHRWQALFLVMSHFTDGKSRSQVGEYLNLGKQFPVPFILPIMPRTERPCLEEHWALQNSPGSTLG